MTYEYDPQAFKHDGRCFHCNGWTRGGARKIGGLRFYRMCGACAKRRGVVVMERAR